MIKLFKQVASLPVIPEKAGIHSGPHALLNGAYIILL